MLEPIPPTDAEGGLFFSTFLPGQAAHFDGGRLTWDDLDRGTLDTPMWIHLDRTKPRAQSWVREQAGLDPSIADALLAEETRPTFQAFDDGMLVILRGLNLTPGAAPDEMIAVRLWVDRRRIISLRQFRFQTIADLRLRAQHGKAPDTPGGFLAALIQGLTMRMQPCAQNLETLLDGIEEYIIEDRGDTKVNRMTLAEVRRQSISLRRYVVPQRDALRELSLANAPLFDSRDLTVVRMAADQVARVADALEELRDRAAVNQDEIRARHEAHVGRTVFLLTIVASVALPLTLLTGMLGMNVGGIPLADSTTGFAVICMVMFVIAVAEFLVLRWLRWI